jgi:hypothetical protein
MNFYAVSNFQRPKWFFEYKETKKVNTALFKLPKYDED